MVIKKKVVTRRKSVPSKKGSKVSGSSGKKTVKKKAKILSSSSARNSVPSKKGTKVPASSGEKVVNKKNKAKKKGIEKVSTGIVNLDKITEGGFEAGSTNLVVGGSGNGKSILATQFLMEGSRKNEPVLYIAFEEKKEGFYANMKGLGWDLEKAEKDGKFFFLSYTPEKVKTMLEEGGGDIETIVLTKGIKRIAIDSITSFVMLFDNEVRMRENVLSLFSLLGNWNCTSLLIYERDPLVDQKQKQRILEFEADSLILLYFTRTVKKRERFLEVYKMRGTNHSKNIFPYKISKNIGIDLSKRAFSGNMEKFRMK